MSMNQNYLRYSEKSIHSLFGGGKTKLAKGTAVMTENDAIDVNVW